MKKFFGMLTVLFTLATLGACGSSNTTAQGQEKDQLAAIKKSGVLKVATSADYAPFEFHTMVDGKDKIVGSDIDLAKAIAKELGVKAEVSDMNFNTVLASLKEGKADLAISAISATDERKQQLDFTDNYYNPPQVVIINKKNKEIYRNANDLKDKNVGAQKGSIQEELVKTQLKGAKLVTIDKVPNMIVEVNQGSLAATVVEKTIAESYIAQNPDLMIADISLEPAPDEAFAIALPKESSELQKELNQIIKKLNDEGKIEEFIQKNNELAEKTAAE
ncbi:transporter substrate-binding domain-containing protein [Enterococcus hirae]|uniref:transporter substrate-binding domain-containing protein n=1 Tax=Enterococcus TaxID=1350 RepID=UPI0019F0E6D6|nr:transporter substrate-binding domain-containing protein [Enterococcus hirae]EMF0203226.1 transporter substrate-binding domain-containing protein [Enterococcus hirae]EMF0378083.1 transporter substrate-binding domain-containing protein [Enterococcus hirae]EMF0404216.1 transporter substrate-binding domain-containing protein [Enterococcus hirae]EMF0419193.1 transporter substrate-binding domain-containing protein [Enterococcus hirae]EMF0514669.1 transporter substrate-binding domain-containing pr